MRTKDLQAELIQVGLSEAEALVYLAALKSGWSLLAPLARAANIPRSSAYDIISQLEQRGLLSNKQAGKRTLYRAVAPQVLLLDVLKRQETIRRLIPSLEALMPGDQSTSLEEGANRLPLEL